MIKTCYVMISDFDCCFSFVSKFLLDFLCLDIELLMKLKEMETWFFYN